MSSSEQDDFERNARKQTRKPKFDRRDNNNLIFNSLKRIKTINEQNVTMTWSVFLNVLDMTARYLPPNMVFVIKIHSSGLDASNDSYHVVRDSQEYKDLCKLAKDENRSMSIFIFLDEINSCGMSDDEYIARITQPGKIQLCFHIPGKPVKKSEADVLNKNRAIDNLTLNFMKLCVNNLCQAVNTYENKFFRTNLTDGDHDFACQFCLQPIVGSRYECEICDDYNLCSSCFDLSDSIHGDDHDFIVRKRFNRTPAPKENSPIPSDLPKVDQKVFEKKASQDDLKSAETDPELLMNSAPDNSNYELIDSNESLEDLEDSLSQASQISLSFESKKDLSEVKVEDVVDSENSDVQNLMDKISGMKLNSANMAEEFKNSHSKRVMFNPATLKVEEERLTYIMSDSSSPPPVFKFIENDEKSQGNYSNESPVTHSKKSQYKNKTQITPAPQMKSQKVTILQNPNRSKTEANTPKNTPSSSGQAGPSTHSDKKSSSTKKDYSFSRNFSSGSSINHKTSIAFQKLTEACQEEYKKKKDSKKNKSKSSKKF